MNKKSSKKQLEKEFNYYHKKVEQMEKEREEDRSWETKELLKKHKKLKLSIKDELEQLKQEEKNEK
jgi:hypothetical protein